MDKYRRKVRRDLDAFGFNTLGCHSDSSYYEPGFAPYIHTLRFVDICHWMTPTEKDFLDVFSTQFEEYCDAKAGDTVIQLRDDPYLIGYSFTDCPIFTDLDAAQREVMIYGASRAGTPTWPRVLRNLGADDAGKRAYVDCVRSIYSDDIRALNRVYNTDFASFNALLDARGWRSRVDPANSDEVRDNNIFLDQVVDRYYRVVVSAVRKYDHNHLILGDKLNGNTDTPDSVVAIAGDYVDLIFYQTYGYYEMQEPALNRWSEITGKPLFNGDSAYSVPGEMMPRPLGPHCADQDERARVSRDFAHRAFSREDFVGWSFCGWMDSWKTHPGQEERQHSGLQDPFGKHYKPMADAFSKFSAEMYDIAVGAYKGS